MRAFLAVCAVIGAPTQVGAHSWYPAACCGELDCAPILPSEVHRVAGGWRILINGEFIPASATRPSPDGQFHRCVAEFWDPESATRCLFTPRNDGISLVDLR